MSAPPSSSSHADRFGRRPYRRNRNTITMNRTNFIPNVDLEHLQPQGDPISHAFRDSFSVSQIQRMDGLQNFIRFKPTLPFTERKESKDCEFWTNTIAPEITALLNHRMTLTDDRGRNISHEYGMKFTITCTVLMLKQDQEIKNICSASPSNVLAINVIPSEVQRQLKRIVEIIEEYYVRGSDLIFSSFQDIDVSYAFYKLDRVSSYIPTPNNLRAKHCTINPKNEEDNACFYWCLCIHHFGSIQTHPERIERYQHRDILEQIQQLNWNWNGIDLTIGVSIDQIELFEKQNNTYAFAIYYWDQTEKYASNAPKMRYISSSWHDSSRVHKISLCILYDASQDRTHYIYVKDYNTLFQRAGAHWGTKFVCPLDGQMFRTQEAYDDHVTRCKKPDNGEFTMAKYPAATDAYCEFTKYYRKLPSPFYIVADMESLNIKLMARSKCPNPHCKYQHFFTKTMLEIQKQEDGKYYCQYCSTQLTTFQKCKEGEEDRPDEFSFEDVDIEIIEEQEQKGKTRFVTEQRSNSQGFYVVCTYDYTQNKKVYINHAIDMENLLREDDQTCGIRFMKAIMNAADECIQKVKERNVPMLPLTFDESKYFLETPNCHICEKPFYSADTRVRDHDHLTGKFRGPAHSICNLNFNYGYNDESVDPEERKLQRDDALTITEEELEGGNPELQHLVRESLLSNGIMPQRKPPKPAPKWKVPVFFHNMKNYDGHFLVQWLHDMKLDNLFVIPQNKEKYTAIMVNNIRFLDSYAFLSSSLDSLVSVNMGKQESLEKEYEQFKALLNQVPPSHPHWKELEDKVNNIKAKLLKNKQEGMKNFPFLQQEFERDFGRTVEPEDREEALDLCFSKGHWPYEYIDDLEKLKETQLPPTTSYSSQLSGSKGLSEEDYKMEQRKWEIFHMRNLKDAHDLYLKLDIILLADVLEKARLTFYKHFQLDLTHYFTLPAFAWDALLKTGYEDRQGQTHRIKIKLFHNDDLHIRMYEKIETGIRGGICMAVRRYAAADNPYVPPIGPSLHIPETPSYTESDEQKENTYLMYVDANQLYSWAMTQYLPYDDYAWVTTQNIETRSIEAWTQMINEMKDDDDQGAFFEVDLDYPPELHESHSDYPLAPENIMIPEEKLSPIMKNIIQTKGLSYMKTEKLIGTLNERNNYMVHYRNLKLYLQQGMRLTAVHSVLTFRQTPWMKTFIEANVKRRALATSDFEKDLWKLVNNAVFGKTMENVKKRCVFELYNEEEEKHIRQFQRRVQNPLYKESVLIGHNTKLLGVMSHKSKVVLDKPIATGMAVLDLSKALMYDFYYNGYKRQYGDKARLVMTDTDSLVMRIRTEDYYKDLLQPGNVLTPYLDFSNYKSLNQKGWNLIPTQHAFLYPDYYIINGITESCELPKYDMLGYYQEGENKKTSFIIPPNTLFDGFQKENNKVQGKFKDENGGFPLCEICCLKPKCYCCYDILNRPTMKAKGIPRGTLKRNFDIEKYKDCIRPSVLAVHQAHFFKLQSIHHSMYMVQRDMVGLSGLDSKRFVLDNNIETIAFGDCRLDSFKQYSIYSH